jgi:serine/threonine protein kinase
MFRQLFEALEYAHRYIVHRDLKPENIWLCEDGTVKLMDFGIARAYSHSQITKTGMTLGTAYYMAPEQQKAAQEVDWRADQYSLGVVLYEMLSGTVPMGAATPLGKLRRDLPKRATRAVMRALAPNPKDRWPSLDELSAQLHAPLNSAGKIAAAVLITVGILVGGKLVVEDFRGGEVALVTDSSFAAYRRTAMAFDIVVPNVSVVLAEPAPFDIAETIDRTATLSEAEVIETEFIEPQRMQPVVQQTGAQQPVVPRPQVRELAPDTAPPHPALRFDPRRPPPAFLPAAPRGTRPPPHPDGRRPPRR